MHIVMLLGNPFRHDARVEKEAEALVDDGHHVTVVALYRHPDERGRETRGPGLVVERVFPTSLGVLPRLRRLADRRWEAPVPSARSTDGEPKPSARRHRTATLALNVIGIVATGIRRSLMRRRFVQVATSLGADAVHAHDAETVRAGGIVARRQGVPLVYDAHELVRHDGTQTRPARLAGHLLEGCYARRAAAILTVSDSIAEVFSRRFPRRRVRVLRNVPEAAGSVSPSADVPAAIAGLPNGPIYLYQGVLTPHRPLVDLIDAVARLRMGNVVFIGPAYEQTDDALRAYAASRHVADRVLVLPPVDRAELPTITATADVGVILLDGRSRNQRFALPNKLFEYIQARVPVCAPALPEIDRVMREHAVGDTYLPGDAADLARALLATPAATTPARLEAAAAAFVWENEKKVLLTVYRELDGAGPTRDRT